MNQRGVCSVCGQMKVIRKDGMLVRHLSRHWDDEYCKGGNRAPMMKSLADTMCLMCRGTGRGPGPDIRRESPVVAGLMVWQHPICPTCGGSGIMP